MNIIDIEAIGRKALGEPKKPVLFGADGRPVSSDDPPKPRLFDNKNAPVRRQIKAEDIEGLDASKKQFIYARTADGRAPTHGNDFKFFAHELDPVKMKEVDPKVVFVGQTTPRPLPPPPPRKKAPPPRNRHERRQREALTRKESRGR